MATTRLSSQIHRRVIAGVLTALSSCGVASQPLPELDLAQFQVAGPETLAPAPLGFKGSIGLDAFDYRRQRPGAPDFALRSALDFRREWRLGSGWSATLSDRVEWVVEDSGSSTVRNAFREGYVSRRWRDSLFVDLGRINLRSGVGSGFNPTDWLREGASLPQPTQNPASLRENRLGTFMLRAQAVEHWGAAQIAAIPHLAHWKDETSPYGFDWGRTNDDKALHARLAPKLSEHASIDLLAYARGGRHPQWGLNLTSIINDAVIAHAELATGKRVGLVAPGATSTAELHQRLAAGFTWTTGDGAVVTVERHLATDALNRGDWAAWRHATDGSTVRDLAQLRSERTSLQEPLTRDAWFVRAAMTGLTEAADVDLAAFVRINPYDGSYLWQVDSGWHVRPRASLYASVGGFAGSSRSEFGANPTRAYLLVRMEMFF